MLVQIADLYIRAVTNLERLEALEAGQKEQMPPPSFWKRLLGNS